MHVAQIWRYPVKSMMGEPVDGAALGEWGVEGDRQWATRDLERGGIRGAKKIAGLMRFGARFTGNGTEAEVTLPDGSTVLTSDPCVHERVSTALEHQVHLEALRPAEDLDFYERGPGDGGDPMEEIRGVFGRVGDEPIPNFSIFPPAIFKYESPPGTFLDAFPLMIMTTSAFAALADALPDSAIDVKRFRPSFVIDTGDEVGHPELAWPGGMRLQVGAATIEIVAPCPRCRMPSLEINEALPRDGAILRHIVKDLDQNVGTYANVVIKGAVKVGDAVQRI